MCVFVVSIKEWGSIVKRIRWHVLVDFDLICENLTAVIVLLDLGCFD